MERQVPAVEHLSAINNASCALPKSPPISSCPSAEVEHVKQSTVDTPPEPAISRKRARQSDTSEHTSSGLQSVKKRKSSPVSPQLKPDVAGRIEPTRRQYINHWTTDQTWPREFFHDMPRQLVALKAAGPPLKRKNSQLSLGATDASIETKSAPYQSANVIFLLETVAGFQPDAPFSRLSKESKKLAERLFENKHQIPLYTAFEDGEGAEATVAELATRNEASVIRIIGQLLVPSARVSARALKSGDHSIWAESANEPWSHCIQLLSPRPQPDFAVGFSAAAYNTHQLNKMHPALRDLNYISFAMSTFWMTFPFLTCEAKRAGGVVVADRQNAHSMCVAVLGLVDLFKLGGREKELQGELLTFSVSHDHTSVSICGYYPWFTNDGEVKVCQLPLRTLNIRSMNGRDRWTTYQFTLNVYEQSLVLLKRILNVIDALPVDFKLSAVPETPPMSSQVALD